MSRHGGEMIDEEEITDERQEAAWKKMAKVTGSGYVKKAKAMAIVRSWVRSDASSADADIVE